MKKLFIIFIIVLCSSPLQSQEDMIRPVKTGFVSCLDNQIYYEELGEGPPLILLHAGYLDVSSWDDQFHFFAENGYRVIRFDSYAHGKTIDGNNTPFLHEIVKALIDSLSLGKVNLVGTSMGGVTIIEFALQYPEDIESMVLVSTGITGYNWMKDKSFAPNLKKQIAYAKDGDTLNTAETFLGSWFDGPLREPNEMDEQKRDKCKQVILQRFKNHGLRKNALTSYPKAIKQYKKIENRCLILIGDQDMPSIKEIAGFLNQGLLNSQMIELKGVGHMMNIEKPDEFNVLVLQFLRGK